MPRTHRPPKGAKVIELDLFDDKTCAAAPNSEPVVIKSEPVEMDLFGPISPPLAEQDHSSPTVGDEQKLLDEGDVEYVCGKDGCPLRWGHTGLCQVETLPGCRARIRRAPKRLVAHQPGEQRLRKVKREAGPPPATAEEINPSGEEASPSAVATPAPKVKKEPAPSTKTAAPPTRPPTGRQRTAPQRLDASLLAVPAYGPGGAARKEAPEEEAEAQKDDEEDNDEEADATAKEHGLPTAMPPHQLELHKSSTASSGYLGVKYRPDKSKARPYQASRKGRWLGSFATVIAAAQAYAKDLAEEQYVKVEPMEENADAEMGEPEPEPEAEPGEDGEDEDDEACAECGRTAAWPGNDILLCDGAGCDGAFHQLCLRPALVDVPEGEWLCSRCAPPTAAGAAAEDAAAAPTTAEVGGLRRLPRSDGEDDEDDEDDEECAAPPAAEVGGVKLYMSTQSRSGYKGVEKRKSGSKPFRAYRTDTSTNNTLGRFATALEAAICYAQWRRGEAPGEAQEQPEKAEACSSAPAAASATPPAGAAAPAHESAPHEGPCSTGEEVTVLKPGEHQHAVGHIVGMRNGYCQVQLAAGEVINVRAKELEHGRTSSEEPATARDDEMEAEEEETNHHEEAVECGRTDSGPSNEILLCDGVGCEGAWHQLCLKPSVLDVPEGEWLCPRCAPPTAAGAAAEDAAAAPQPTTTAPPAEAMDVDEEEAEDVQAEELEVDADEGDEECAECGRTDSGPSNEILLCDGVGCDGAWHQLCLKPSVLDVPEGEWLCPRCAPPTAAEAAPEDQGARVAAASPPNATAPSPAVPFERPKEKVPPLEQEAALCVEETEGRLRFQLMRAERWQAAQQGATMPALLCVRSLYATNLPLMDSAYLVKMIFDPQYVSLVCTCESRGTVAAALTCRLFELAGERSGGGAAGPSDDSDGAAVAMCAELALCAVLRRFQVQGLGSRLVSRFKGEMAARGVRRIVTTADNFAIGFWNQQGFTRVTMPRKEWQGIASAYSNGILMECELSSALPYTRMPQAVRACREQLLKGWESVDAPNRSEEPQEERSASPTVVWGGDFEAAAAGLSRAIATDGDHGGGMNRLAPLSIPGAPSLAGKPSRELSAAAGMAHEALPPSIRETLAGPAKPKCNKAHGLAALHTRLNAAYYVSAPQVLGDMHRMGLGKTVTTHSATRTALLAVAPPMEALTA